LIAIREGCEMAWMVEGIEVRKIVDLLLHVIAGKKHQCSLLAG
jgi:hypothetical protein